MVSDMTGPADVLSQRALNRATLDRQMLLARRALPAAGALSHLVGMQAQAPNAPYVGLWSRLSGFRHGELARLIAERQAVRIHVMRATIHLVTAADALALRPLTAGVLARGFAGQAFARNIEGIDLDALLAAGRDLLAERPRTRAELARDLAGRWPGYDPASLAYAVSYLVPLVQVPPRGLWGETGPAAWALAETWLGQRFDPDPSPDRMVLRYLAAFGPATVADVQAWSGLTRLREVTERLGPQLRSFRDADGAELLDLPGAPRPDPDTPAPPRFLPEYDNLLFGHANRARVIAGNRPVPLPAGNGGRLGTVLLDGWFGGTWQISLENGAATLEIRPFAPLPAREHAAVCEEGARLLAFAAGDHAGHDVRVT
jgi:hypothetical protein